MRGMDAIEGRLGRGTGGDVERTAERSMRDGIGLRGSAERRAPTGVAGDSGELFGGGLVGGELEAFAGGELGALTGGELGAFAGGELGELEVVLAREGTLGDEGTSNASAGTVPSSVQSDMPFFHTSDCAETRPILSASSSSSVDITAISSPPTFTR